MASLLTATNAQARFLQTDPVGYKDGPDWYLYVGDDPLNHADPTGLTCADGKGPCSPEQLRQTQQNFKNYVETQVAPTTNKQLAIGGGAIIATGITAGAAGATVVGAAGAGEVTTSGALAVGGTIERGSLTEAQTANLVRFESKIPANSSQTTITAGKDGSVVMSATSPGRVPGSSATYVKTADATGKTIGYEKITRTPSGEIAHVKDKFNTPSQ